MKLIVLNTIGLTGVEALLARMNSIENVLTLPGQNFAMFNQAYIDHMTIMEKQMMRFLIF